MIQSNTRRAIGSLAVFAVAAGFAVTIGGGMASAAPGDITWSDQYSTFTRTIDNATPTVGDTITVTTKWTRTDANWEKLNSVKDYHSTCLTYVPGSAKVTDNAGVHNIEPYVQPAADFTAADFVSLGYQPTAKRGVETPILSIQYKVGDDCARGTALDTGMSYSGSRGPGSYPTKGPAITVAKNTSTTALAAVPASVQVGQTVPLNATVTGGADGDIVEFYNGTTKIGQGTLTAGKAPLAWTPALGAHSLTAKFLGTAKATESVSTAQNVLVTSDADEATTTVLTVPATATTNVAVDLVADVSPTPAGGTVQFKDGDTNIGEPVTLVNGKATLSHKFLTAGTSHITAIYSGTSGHLTSTSEASTVTVTDAPDNGGGTGSGGSLGNIFGSLGSIFGS